MAVKRGPARGANIARLDHRQDQLFICRNSWGPGWGDAGYFYMHYPYLLDNNLSSDFWKISLVGQG